MVQHFGLARYEQEFIRALNEEGAKFLVVGGRAVKFYCAERMTNDLDLLVGLDSNNLVAVMNAMGRVDPRFFRQRWPKADMRPSIQASIDLHETHGDVLTSIPGVTFESAWEARVIAASNAGEISLISLHHLIENKRADVARDPKAASDLTLLTKQDVKAM